MGNAFTERLRGELQGFSEAGVYKKLNHLDSPQAAKVRMEGRGDVIILSSNNYLGLCDTPEVIEAGNGFDWQQLAAEAAAFSLFAEKKIIDLRVPNGKPGAEGSKALCEYLELAGGDDVLLIVAGKIDRGDLVVHQVGVGLEIDP